MDEIVIKIVLTEEVKNFIASLPGNAANKVRYNLHRVACGERNIEIFKKLENTEIWEFRTRFNKMAYRLFAFWDKETETMIITTHGIIKKTQKTPHKEIAKAESIMKYYFEQKNNKGKNNNQNE